MSILVLGATGNTGSQVVAQLQQKKADFRVLVRDYQSAKALGLTDLQIYQGNFDDVVSLQAAMHGVRAVYLSMVAHPDNERWVDHVIAAMQASGASHLVKLSGMGASMDAGAEIIRVHARTDAKVKASGLSYTLIQPNSFYQNLYASLPTINEYGQFFLPLGDAKQSVVDIRDVAAVAVCALIDQGHEQQTYRLTGPQSLTFAEQAQLLSQACGRTIHYIPVTKKAAAQAMKQAGMSDWLADHLAEILDWFGQGGYDEVTNDVARVLGRAPRRFEDFAQAFASQITFDLE
ncbi:NAD(P)H azoreductase [Vibrio stylophorae]|uniref:NAD(P)H azoreductase n=1 Tax=Vibrio stylophorae TaxID=659351 RepID=A0ABN8DUJ7_9VIBR|nr:SDR family oxidoreductase [Vibrio stylophorae]CAH0533595.1 NAD(P)H azoreductase [Vibrio stylophorae]